MIINNKLCSCIVCRSLGSECKTPAGLKLKLSKHQQIHYKIKALKHPAQTTVTPLKFKSVATKCKLDFKPVLDLHVVLYFS